MSKPDATVHTLRTSLTIPVAEVADWIEEHWTDLFVVSKPGEAPAVGEYHERHASREVIDRLRSAFRRAARRTGRKISTHANYDPGRDEWLMSVFWRGAPDPSPEETAARHEAIRAALNRSLGPPEGFGL